MMTERILMAGSGGQGVILIGKLLATVAVDSVPHVTFFPAYGAEVRGGTSNCQLVFSEKEIASPVSEAFDSMIILNRESAKRYAEQMQACRLCVVNVSLCDPESLERNAVGVPATETANTLGDGRVANFIMLGAYLAHRPVVPVAAVREAIRTFFMPKGRKLVDLNLEALRLGMEA